MNYSEPAIDFKSDILSAMKDHKHGMFKEQLWTNRVKTLKSQKKSIKFFEVDELKTYKNPFENKDKKNQVFDVKEEITEVTDPMEYVKSEFYEEGFLCRR